MFPHESTPVYQQALEFAKWCESVLERTPKQTAMHTQLDHARTTIVLKVAAGVACVSREDKSFDTARTAAIESAACLDLLFNKRIVSRDELQRGKELLEKLIAFLAADNATEPQVKAA